MCGQPRGVLREVIEIKLFIDVKVVVRVCTSTPDLDLRVKVIVVIVDHRCQCTTKNIPICGREEGREHRIVKINNHESFPSQRRFRRLESMGFPAPSIRGARSTSPLQARERQSGLRVHHLGVGGPRNCLSGKESCGALYVLSGPVGGSS